MKIKLFHKNIYFTIIICLISFIKSDLVIIAPNELASRFNSQPIDIVLGKISDYLNFYIHGEIVFENKTVLHDACTQLGTLSTKINENEFYDNLKILLAYNDNCPILQKARNAQNAGASMLLLINNNDQEIKNIVLEDDFSSDIKISIGLISFANGKIFHNYIENNPKSRIIIDINYQKKIEQKKIEVKFVFSSSELKAYELINNITKYSNHFYDYVDFIPIYVIHQSPSYNPQKAMRELNCVSKGKYCYFPKETTITQDGQRILIESLRQKCMFLKSKEKLKYYYEYLNIFYNNCLNKDNPKFNERCAKQTLDNMGYAVDYLDECVAKSFGVNSLLSTSYIDNENTIFKKDYDEILKYKLSSFPAVIIDDKPLKGKINPNKIMINICNSFSAKPDFCSIIIGESWTISRKKGMIFFLIIVIIIINIYLFCKFRKYVLLKINEKFGLKIDIEGRINNVVQNYISLKNQGGDDYQSFESNTSSKNNNKNDSKIEGTVNTV